MKKKEKSNLAKKFKGLMIETHDDDWIIEHADELKAALIELIQAGKPRPKRKTVLGRALELFTTK